MTLSFVFGIIAQIILGLIYGNFAEWAAHKFLLHKLGKRKKKGNIFAFHWYIHHRKARIKHFIDDDYQESFWNWNARGKEAFGLFLLTLTHVWLFFIAPVFTLTLIYCVINYYLVHKKGHMDPEWAKRKIPWHWDHHCSKIQDANYNVTKPISDRIFCTRIFYRDLGTHKQVVIPRWWKMEF